MTAPTPKRPVWAYIGLALGGLVSVSGNVLHTFVPPEGGGLAWSPEKPAVGVAAFWPVALYVAIEILARTDWRRDWVWVALRWIATLPVAGVAAVVSYQHLSGLLKHWGEAEAAWRFGPLAVDGLIVLATGALIGATAARTAAGDASSSPDEAAPPMGVTGFGAEYDPHEAATSAATGLLAEITAYLTAEGERLQGVHGERQAVAGAEAGRITERAALTAARDAERAARRADRAAWWPRLVALLGASGTRATDGEIRAWLADEADRTGTVPSRADVREFFGKAPANARLDEIRREVIQARAGEPAGAVPGAAGR